MARRVLAVLAIAGLVACGEIRRPPVAPVAMLPPAAPAWVVGQPLPPLTLVDDGDHAVPLPSLGGAPTVLLFFRSTS